MTILEQIQYLHDNGFPQKKRGPKPKPKIKTEFKLKPIRNKNYTSKDRPNFIYFIQSENGLVKIGLSVNVNQRFASFCQTSPCKLSLLKTIYGGENYPSALSKEREIHSSFSHLRHHSEWFNLTKELLNYINSLE